MTHLADTSVLAIDGGGTRCRIALASDSRRVQIEAGSANVSTDFDGAVRTISAGVDTLASEAGITPGTLHQLPIYMSLAGIKGPALPDRLCNVLPFRNIRAEDDRIAAVRGAIGTASGAVIHCGTGSFLAVQTEDGTRFAGGWGPVLGDIGSAMWMGRSALTATLDAEDGLRTPSPMTRAMLDRFKGPDGIVAFAASATPADFGAIAPLILPFGESGDPVVGALLSDLSDFFDDTLNKIGWSGSTPVTLTGGIAPMYAPYLSEAIQSNLAKPQGSPMDGAIALAQDFAREVRG